MTNLECAVAVLTKHREARQWTDEAVAADLLAQLGLDAAAEVTDATAQTDADTTDTSSSGSRRSRGTTSA